MAQLLPEELLGIEGRWWLLGAVVVVGVKGFRPLTKNAIKGYFALRDGLGRVATQTNAGLQELYQEARADYEATRSPVEVERREFAAEAASPAPLRRRRRQQGTEAAGERITAPAE